MDPIDQLIAETDETEQELREALAAAEGRIAVLESDGRRLLETVKGLIAAAGADEAATMAAWKELRTVVAGVENGPLGMTSVVAPREAMAAGVVGDSVDTIG